MGPSPTQNPDGLALSDLLDVQDVDLTIDRLIHQRQTLPELAKYQEAAGRREGLEALRAEKGAVLRSLELDLDKAEGELEIVEIKLKESETRLYAGGMNARETDQKRLEVQSLRGQQSALEDRVLGLIDQVDPVRSEVNRIDARLASTRAEESALEKVIADAWRQIDARSSASTVTPGTLLRPRSTPCCTSRRHRSPPR